MPDATRFTRAIGDCLRPPRLAFFADDFLAPLLAPFFAAERDVPRDALFLLAALLLRAVLLPVLLLPVLLVLALLLPARVELFRAPRFAVLVLRLALFAELRLLLLLALFRPPAFVALLRDADLRRGAAAAFEVPLREPARRELRDDFLAAILFSGTRWGVIT